MEFPKKAKSGSRKRQNLTRFDNVHFNYDKFVRRHFMEHGKAYITAQIDVRDDIISKYSVTDYEWISPEFAAYVEGCAFYIPIEDEIVLEITGRRFSNTEKAVIRRVVTDYFGAQLSEKLLDLDNNKKRGVELSIFGAVSIALFVLFSYVVPAPLIRELFLIYSWFSLWEAAELILFDRKDLRMQKREAGQLVAMEITFLDPPADWEDSEISDEAPDACAKAD